MSPSHFHNLSNLPIAKRLVCTKLATRKWNSKLEPTTFKYPVDFKHEARLNKRVEICIRMF
ncbi:hypothetical protein AJ78_01061 [Emergomyces pasteurianus Ep9510]|uniref:Uncharacterized protein n=1 Tax=Emergomyces pasteurianus Ep9510 TaxID=1447872 RepID=A0A1J9QUK5_9EURO|nr:hypothetical protein AJ78_01061 [Emergomyces pasteurianus Ep9510]